VSFAEYRLFNRALLQKRPVILRSLLLEATSYTYCNSHDKIRTYIHMYICTDWEKARDCTPCIHTIPLSLCNIQSLSPSIYVQFLCPSIHIQFLSHHVYIQLLSPSKYIQLLSPFAYIQFLSPSIYIELHLTCHLIFLKSQWMIYFSRSLLPCSVEKRPSGLRLEIVIKWHSKCNRLHIQCSLCTYTIPVSLYIPTIFFLLCTYTIPLCLYIYTIPLSLYIHTIPLSLSTYTIHFSLYTYTIPLSLYIYAIPLSLFLSLQFLSPSIYIQFLSPSIYI